MTSPLPPDISDIKAAASRIRSEAVRTPMLTSAVLNERTGGRIFIKPENLQRTGSFKFRGAYNALSASLKEAQSGGVVASSSGNHAQGIAEAARLLGIKATMVMPSDAPRLKIERTKNSGATVIEYDRLTEDRDAISEKLANETRALLVHPFNHPDVIAGQGTIGLEIAQDFVAKNVSPDICLVCCGGGGLYAGIMIGLSTTFPDTVFHPVEPVGFDDYTRSLAQGKRVANKLAGGTICDAIATPLPGEISFAVTSPKSAPGLTVTDEEAVDAVRFAYRELKLVAEPGGAVALAAILSKKIDCSNKTVVLTISGGNIDADLFAKIIGNQPLS